MKSITIKDIYAGKPDAKDEINFDGLEYFIKALIVPNNCNLNSLMTGNHCFITGYKGTGKTSLLFFLDDLIKKNDLYACSSFIFFKEDFSDISRRQIENFSNRVLSSVSIDKNILIQNTNFEYIWRWIFFNKIISDNKEFNDGLYVDNDEWQEFKKIMSKIQGPLKNRKSIIPPKVKIALGLKYSDPNTGAIITPDIEVDFQNHKDENNLNEFITLIDEAEQVLKNARRTDIPYHIFVDELEAYYGDKEVFTRDLYLIRDLIFSIKRLNTLFALTGMKNTKIICSVRTEIVNAISKFIVPKELNKVISGFEVPLKWDYNNTNSYTHPIIQILLRRIALSEIDTDDKISIDKYISDHWFPEQIHDIEPANYILNNSWYKPRDIVRLIISAQNGIHNDSCIFSQAVFDTLQKQYSYDSLVEIKEEMRALYSSEEIEIIVNCFNGFRSIFSYTQLQEKVSKYYSNTILGKDLVQILKDLYRLGFIGNYLPASQSYRWQHKGDDNLILSDEWRIMVHQALQNALSISKRQDYSLKRKDPLQTGDIVYVTVIKINPAFLKVSFEHYGKQFTGSIHISELSEESIDHISTFACIGDEFKAKVLNYNSKYSLWNLSLRM